MYNEELVSIIVPVYKAEKYIDQCVEAIISQTYKKIEIILVDDGSPDNSSLKCDIWKTKDERIRVIHKENGGVSEARNVGIQQSSGNWLLFIDSDDVVPHDFLATMMKDCNDRKTLVVSKMIRFSDEIPSYQPENKCPIHKGKDLIACRGGMYACGALYSRKIVSEIELSFGISLRNLEDVVWNGIYLRYIENVILVDIPYYYRVNPTSITSNCGDSNWQVSSWLIARAELLNWFRGKALTELQRKEVKKLFRHCQNNIYAECLAGNIRYNDFRVMEIREGLEYYQAFILAPERTVLNYLPRIYYWLYKWMVYIKRFIA